MPNLQVIADDPAALKSSVDTMMGLRNTRGEVRLNHGIRTAEELDALVQAALANGTPDDGGDIETFRRLLEHGTP